MPSQCLGSGCLILLMKFVDDYSNPWNGNPILKQPGAFMGYREMAWGKVSNFWWAPANVSPIIRTEKNQTPPFRLMPLGINKKQSWSTWQLNILPLMISVVWDKNLRKIKLLIGSLGIPGAHIFTYIFSIQMHQQKCINMYIYMEIHLETHGSYGIQLKMIDV